jgi:hypothetical protein
MLADLVRGSYDPIMASIWVAPAVERPRPVKPTPLSACHLLDVCKGDQLMKTMYFMLIGYCLYIFILASKVESEAERIWFGLTPQRELRLEVWDEGGISVAYQQMRLTGSLRLKPVCLRSAHHTVSFPSILNPSALGNASSDDDDEDDDDDTTYKTLSTIPITTSPRKTRWA